MLGIGVGASRRVTAIFLISKSLLLLMPVGMGAKVSISSFVEPARQTRGAEPFGVARQSKPCSLRQSSLTDACECRPAEVASENYDVRLSSWCKAWPFGPPPLAASGLTPACPRNAAPPSDVWQIVAGRGVLIVAQQDG